MVKTEFSQKPGAIPKMPRTNLGNAVSTDSVPGEKKWRDKILGAKSNVKRIAAMREAGARGDPDAVRALIEAAGIVNDGTQNEDMISEESCNAIDKIGIAAIPTLLAMVKERHPRWHSASYSIEGIAEKNPGDEKVVHAMNELARVALECPGDEDFTNAFYEALFSGPYEITITSRK
jgi:hypothetical protein